MSDGRTDIQPTPREAGLMLTVTVKAYDSGMIELDGRPVSQRHDGEYDTLQGWTDTAEYLVHKLNELRKAVAARQRDLASGSPISSWNPRARRLPLLTWCAWACSARVRVAVAVALSVVNMVVLFYQRVRTGIDVGHDLGDLFERGDVGQVRDFRPAVSRVTVR